MDEVPEKKKFWIYLFIIYLFFSPSLYTPIPYFMMTTMIRQDNTIDEDKITENDKMIDNELMKMTGV